VACTSADEAVDLGVAVEVREHLAGSALFTELAEASRFFEQGSIGWSPAHDTRRVEGLTLETTGWRMEAGDVQEAHSSFFDDPSLFPPGTAVLDCALVMRRVPAVWRPLPAREHAGSLS
jgi:hypothetical protein